MSEWEEDLLALFDSLDEAAQAEALAAAQYLLTFSTNKSMFIQTSVGH